MKPERYTTQQVNDALRSTKGMVTLAAEKLGCHPNTIQGYINRHPSVSMTLKEARDKMTDAVELKLYEGIMKGNPAMTIFYLKTVGRDRGYVEKLIIEGSIQVELVNKVVKAAEDAGLDASELFNDLLGEIAAIKQSISATGDSAPD